MEIETISVECQYGCSFCDSAWGRDTPTHLIQPCPRCHDSKGEGACPNVRCVECNELMCDACAHQCATCEACYHEACMPTHWFCDVSFDCHAHCGREEQCLPFLVPPCEECKKPSLNNCQEYAQRRCRCCGKLLCERCHQCAAVKNSNDAVEKDMNDLRIALQKHLA